MRLRLLIFLIIFIENYQKGKCIKIVDLKVPDIIDPRQEKIKLYCNYELDEGEKLYSIRWYKDLIEFFRFMPDENESRLAFNVDGLKVSINDSYDKIITLIQNINLSNYETSGLAGSYGCEVSTEPTFYTKYDAANMSVAILPQRDPALEGLHSYYDDDDILEAQCTSSPSFPPAKLEFYINDKMIEKSFTRELPGLGLVGGNVVSMTRLGLSLKLDQNYFNSSGSLRITCKSILPGISGVKSRETSQIILLETNNERFAQEAKVSISSSSSSSSSSTSTLSLTLNKNYFNNHTFIFTIITIIIF